ncbi:response regulator [Acetobacter sp. AN02]|uniref:PhyR family response regulator anti-anti-sigma factor n=1 Tax=Acetobacter sp. AN02 TaxID=2894186 RepID=UPI00243437CE|nr:response regulator [Acetobacter sp. AN02]MDG6093975.1 response regulator [Acetobacter sp. AN02]
MSESQRSELIRTLPYARRFARALTGSQSDGDLLVAESLRDLSRSPSGQLAARLTLYQAICERAARVLSDAEDITSRCLLLLISLEDLPEEEAADVLRLSPDQADTLLAKTYETLKASARTSILIIEDEPVIAMDIEDQVRACGHTIAGVAHTHKEAVALAREQKPGLILADINLGTGGNGIEAVAEILRDNDVPVIFVTAYPESLLTGNTVEPAFVITKPFEPTTLAIATYQATSGGVRVP